MSHIGKNYTPELPNYYNTLWGLYKRAMVANTEIGAINSCALVTSHLEALQAIRQDGGFNTEFLKKLGNDMAHIVRLGHSLAVQRIGRIHKDRLTETMGRISHEYGAPSDSHQRGLGST